jgi:hypothetical protein
MPPDALDLRACAAELGVTYGWLQRSWRTWPGFPRPYKGEGKGERPLWWRQAIGEFKAGRRFIAGAPAEAPPSAVSIANDTHPAPPPDPVARALAAMGG